MTNTPEIIEKYDSFVFQSTDYPDSNYAVFGLGGETGEVIEVVKKLHRKYGNNWSELCDESEENRILDEMGDVLWYLVRITQLLGRDFSDVMKMNIEKLTQRKDKKVRDEISNPPATSWF